MTSTASASQRPTVVRFGVLGVTVLMSVLLYLDRFCITFAERLIKEDLGLTNQQMSLILGAFFLTYALGQVPSGWLSDRFGGRTMLTLYILGWSLFTIQTGLASGLLVLFTARFLFGLAQAGAYPTAGNVLSKWIPFASRGKASAAVAWGGRIGGAIAPIVTALLIVFNVPTSVPSTLSPVDMLNPGQLADKLAASGVEQGGSPAARSTPASSAPAQQSSALPAQQRIWQKLSPTGRLAAEQLATAWRPWHDQAVAAQKQQPPGKIEPFVADERLIKDGLLPALNALLASPDLYDAGAFADIKLAPEATRLLRASEQQSSLGSDEQTRLNRLLLEAVYPEEIRKVYVAGWRKMLIIFGSIGLLVALVFAWVCRNEPSSHPWCNRAEVELIASGRPADSPSSSGRGRGLPLWCLITSRSMWLNSLSQAGTNIGWVFLVTWLPRYMAEVHHVPLETRSWMATVVLAIGGIGMLLGGWLTDRMVQAFGLRWGRGLPMGLTRLVAAAAFLFCLLPLSSWFGPRWTPWVLTGAFSAVAFFTDLGVASVWAYCQDVGGRQVGSVLGWGNMWGNLGAAVSPYLLNHVFELNQSWNQAFVLCAVSFLISSLAGLFVDATVPVAPRDED